MSWAAASRAPVSRATPFSAPYRVRFDEAGPDGLVRTSVLLRFAQDVAWLHSDALGFDRDWYEARGLVWLVRAAEVVVSGAVASGDQLEVSTRVIGFRHVLARRRAEVRRAGAVLATVDTDWVMTDADRGAPTRIPEAILAGFPVSSHAFSPLRAALDGEGPSTGTPFRARPDDLDPLGHANNGAYLDWLEAAVADLPDGPGRLVARPRTIRLEYVRPAGPAEDLVAATWVVARDPGSVAYHVVARSDGSERLRATHRT